MSENKKKSEAARSVALSEWRMKLSGAPIELEGDMTVFDDRLYIGVKPLSTRLLAGVDRDNPYAPLAEETTFYIGRARVTITFEMLPPEESES